MTASVARQVFYGIAGVAGLTLTWYFNLRFIAAAGPTGYVRAWFANDASSSAAVDLIVVSTAVSVFMMAEGRRLAMRVPLLYVVLGFVVAMAFALPLFLLGRERAMNRSRVVRATRRGVMPSTAAVEGAGLSSHQQRRSPPGAAPPS